MLRLFRDLALVEAVKCQDVVCWKHQVMKAEINQQQLSMHERLWCAKELRWIIPKSYTCSKISSVVLQFQKQRFKVSQKKFKTKNNANQQKNPKTNYGTRIKMKLLPFQNEGIFAKIHSLTMTLHFLSQTTQRLCWVLLSFFFNLHAVLVYAWACVGVLRLRAGVSLNHFPSLFFEAGSHSWIQS